MGDPSTDPKRSAYENWAIGILLQAYEELKKAEAKREKKEDAKKRKAEVKKLMAMFKCPCREIMEFLFITGSDLERQAKPEEKAALKKESLQALSAAWGDSRDLTSGQLAEQAMFVYQIGTCPGPRCPAFFNLNMVRQASAVARAMGHSGELKISLSRFRLNACVVMESKRTASITVAGASTKVTYKLIHVICFYHDPLPSGPGSPTDPTDPPGYPPGGAPPTGGPDPVGPPDPDPAPATPGQQPLPSPIWPPSKPTGTTEGQPESQQTAVGFVRDDHHSLLSFHRVFPDPHGPRSPMSEAEVDDLMGLLF